MGRVCWRSSLTRSDSLGRGSLADSEFAPSSEFLFLSQVSPVSIPKTSFQRPQQVQTHSPARSSDQLIGSHRTERAEILNGTNAALSQPSTTLRPDVPQLFNRDQHGNMPLLMPHRFQRPSLEMPTLTDS